MKGEQVLIIIEDLQRECMNHASDEFMACLDKIHKYVEQESDREQESARMKTKQYIAERSFDRYKSETVQSI